MAWSDPMTAVANEIWTAAEFNQHVRDNLEVTAPALATGAGQHFVKDGLNSITTRSIETDTVQSYQGTTSNSYGDLSTIGPQVTVDTGTSALVMFSISCFREVDSVARSSLAVSGNTTISADDNEDAAGIIWQGFEENNVLSTSKAWMATSLTAGSNTFTLKYLSQNSGDNCIFGNRTLIVIPF